MSDDYVLGFVIVIIVPFIFHFSTKGEKRRREGPLPPVRKDRTDK